MSKRDTSTTRDIWLAAVLTYLGYELCSITDDEGYKTSIYRVQCPEMDFTELEIQYAANQLPLADARSFVNAFNILSHRQRDYRKRGDTQWTNPRWVSGEIG